MFSLESAKNLISRIRNTVKGIRSYAFNSRLPESVYFYTFHKCASTLFSNYVLKNVDLLHHVNYATQIYQGRRSPSQELTFQERGFIYGPIRISAIDDGPVGKTLVEPTISHDFVRDKTAIFFVRDPRDILISSYYSYGFTHGLSRVGEIRERQEARRSAIQALTLDEYVLRYGDDQVFLFNTLYDLSQACRRSAILKYEDMIDDFDEFIEQLLRFVSLKGYVIKEIQKRSRPKDVENTASHRRSGQTQGFRHKLEDSTIAALNHKLADVLSLFGYPL